MNPGDARFCGACGFQLGSDTFETELPAVADPLVGRVIADRYRILALLGRGGMGVVYKVEHIHIGKLMAMKLLHGELSGDAATVKRFRREAEVVAKLTHENTVQVFDHGKSEGMMYLVMEYLEGRDLGVLIRREGFLDFPRVAKIAQQVCASVSEAHAMGVVHRDLKPENVFILETPQGERAKVLDFGLAKLRDQSDANLSVTRAGAIVGTPYYMPPEQIRGDAVDPRGDVYAIGAMIYKACSGSPPFMADTPMGVLTKHLTEELEPPSQRGNAPVPPEADAIVGKAMRKKAEDRYPSAEALRQDLLAYLAQAGELQTGEITLGDITAMQEHEPLATRADVDRYERRLARRGRALSVLLALLLVGMLAGAALAYERMASEPTLATAEVEPNDEPEQANDLPERVSFTGKLGQRQSPQNGDRDLYRIANAGPGTRLLEVRFSGLPNLDAVLELFASSGGEPSLRVAADVPRVGAPELLANFPLPPGDYLLGVREHWIQGRPPVENVSDEYTIEWRLRERTEGEEIEVNDDAQRAQRLALGESVRGYIGWGGDVDTYCVGESADAVLAEASGVDDMNLVLVAVDTVRGTRADQDAAGRGAGESLRLAPAYSGRSCVEVRVAEEDGLALRASAEAAYTFAFRLAP
ncbi:MAG: serine/threonine-protein kinase [Myxococcota bacterium]